MNPSTTAHRPLLVLVAAAAVIAGLLALPPATASPRAADDIVGTWAAGLGEVTVTGSGTSYTGTVSKTITGFLCQHPVGETIWTITGSGPEYTGQGRFDFNTGCPGPMSNAKFTLISPNMLGVSFVGPTGISATMYLAQRVASSTPDDEPSTGPDTTAPVVEVVAPTRIYKGGQRIPIQYRVTDDSGKAQVDVAIFSDGQVVARGGTSGYVPAKGRTQTATTKKPVKATKGNRGPYYFCVSARDKAGNVSEAECAWISIQIPVRLVANGCGGAQFGEAGVVAQNWLLDERRYDGYKVSFRRACDLHDAGYAGVTVADPFTGKVTDFRTYSRKDVDDKFLRDMRAECARYLNTSPAEDLAACQNGQTVGQLVTLAAASVISAGAWATLMEIGAFSYYDAVRQYATAAYDADPTVNGGQQSCTADPRLPDNCRDNS